MRALLLEARIWLDYEALRDKDKKRHVKLCKILKDMLRHPETGKGKPEQLQENFSGMWSRRLDQKNRVVYRLPNYKNGKADGYCHGGGVFGCGPQRSACGGC